MSRKLFKHTLVPKAELTTQNINGQRFYSLPDGTLLKPVTSVLSEKLDKTALLEWKARVGEEEAQRISVQAARRGTAIHNIAERYVLNEDRYYSPNEMPINIESFKPIKSVLDAYVDNILGVQQLFVGLRHGRALGDEQQRDEHRDHGQDQGAGEGDADPEPEPGVELLRGVWGSVGFDFV